VTPAESVEAKPFEPRLWPGIALVAVQWFLWVGLQLVWPGGTIVAFLGALGCAIPILIWWLFFSRVPPGERWGVFGLIVASMVVTRLALLHPSVASGSMGMTFVVHATPAVCLALVAATFLSKRMAIGTRRATFAASIVLACLVFTLLRTDGITGEGKSQFTWRWKKTSEEMLLARGGAAPAPPPAVIVKDAPAPAAPVPSAAPAPTAASPVATPSSPAAVPKVAPKITKAAWPGFRGPHRDGQVPALRIKTDWAASAPVELWRRQVGPAWSSFAVGEELFYTQEQRGDAEVVACYRLATGEPVWAHRSAARFWESNAGAGPRGTPTLSGGRVYALGATGIMNALDAATGSVLWTRNAATDTGAKVPEWGFSASPLIAGDLVIAATSGRVAAYDINSGQPRWIGPKIGGSYSSPHLVTIDGVEQVLMMAGTGTTSFSPADGKILWQHAWPGSTILQPMMTADGGVLITSGDMSGGVGTRRLSIAHGQNGWTAEEVWTSKGLKPYFSDLVVHEGHAYGFDGSILSCIDLKDGSRKWKGGRYGHGQMVVLSAQNLLLITSEEGELVLVGATPDQFTEVARFKAIEGKTWNHPVVVGDTILVRNGQEMAAFRLPRAD
jgi:outer membrane protein assembly factor BamB